MPLSRLSVTPAALWRDKPQPAGRGAQGNLPQAPLGGDQPIRRNRRANSICQAGFTDRRPCRRPPKKHKKMVAGPGTAGDFDSRSKSDRIPPFYAQKCRIWLSASHKKQSPANGKKRQSRRHYGNKWQYQNSVQCPIHRRSIYPVIVVFASSRRLFCGRTPEPIRRRRSDGVTGYGNSRTAAAATADLWKFYRAGRSAGRSKEIPAGWTSAICRDRELLEPRGEIKRAYPRRFATDDT